MSVWSNNESVTAAFTKTLELFKSIHVNFIECDFCYQKIVFKRILVLSKLHIFSSFCRIDALIYVNINLILSKNVIENIGEGSAAETGGIEAATKATGSAESGVSEAIVSAALLCVA